MSRGGQYGAGIAGGGTSAKPEPDDPFRGRCLWHRGFIFSVDNDPGQGPKLHIHPYPETWIVKSGRARIVAGAESFEVGPNDIAVVPGGVPHKFTNIGPDRLVMFCVHAAGTMVQQDLE